MAIQNFVIKKNNVQIRRIERGDSQLSWIIILFVFYIFIVNLLHGYSSYLNFNVFVFSNILQVFIASICLLRIKLFIVRINKLSLLIFLVSLLTTLLNLLLFPNNDNIIWVYIGNFMTPFLAMITLLSIKNFSILVNKLTSLSVIIAYIALSIFFTSVFFRISFNLDNYSMAYGYSLLFPSLILFNKYFKSKNLKYLLLAFGIVIIIFLHGSRGPFLCLGVYFLIILSKSNKSRIIYLFFFISLFSINYCFN